MPELAVMSFTEPTLWVGGSPLTPLYCNRFSLEGYFLKAFRHEPILVQGVRLAIATYNQRLDVSEQR